MRRFVLVLGPWACLVPLVGAILRVGRIAVKVQL
jgi:hypothetical protein